MGKVKITKTRSSIGKPQKQKRTLEALGLRKINQSIVKELNPQLQGMIDRIHHLVKVEEA